jgi:MoaA/NifB/PqqE/SkfB family radical SAM enzyme
MDQGKYERSIDEIVLLGAERVTLTGFGEPFLDKNLAAKIRYARDRGLHVHVITNGSALNERRRAEIIDAGLDELRVSFYGMSRETYNAVMRGLRFDTTLANINAFLCERKKTKVYLFYLVLPENEADVNAFSYYWRNLADAIEIWRPHNFGDGRGYRERAGEKKTCGRPRFGPLQIQWNGEVIPCCYDYNNNIVLGNAFEQPIPDILSGARYNTLRDQHDTGNFPPYCDQCDQLLEHTDALVYSNRHDLPREIAVKLSNTDLSDITDG